MDSSNNAKWIGEGSTTRKVGLFKHSLLRIRSLGLFGVTLVLGITLARADPAVWQWSVPMAEGRAFLWIPENCQRVRAVIVGQHNMSEERVLEHPVIRREFAALGIAEVWIVPPSEAVFDFNAGAGDRFEKLLGELGAESGYGELAFAPVIPIGHSACASYPWNFAAWNPGRTLAAISLHGDAPLTPLTGSGRPNPDWGRRTLDGVPGLMMMAEYEWIEERLAPALIYRVAHPAAPIALLAEPGTGHFDVSEDAIAFLALFVRKAVHHRLPLEANTDRAPTLTPIGPSQGWLVQRWRLNQKRPIPPARFADYRGDPADAFWCFDEEMALATHHFREAQIGRQPQLLGYVQGGSPRAVPQTATHHQVGLAFQPQADGLTFRLNGMFLETVDGGSPNTTRWTGLTPGAPLGHATGGGAIVLSRIIGPVVQLAPDTFRVQLNRTASTVDRRSNDIWLLASHPGDATFKSAVQQSLLKLASQTTGAEQHISFADIPNRSAASTGLVQLRASSDAGVPVGFYVREGPAYVAGDTLHLTAIPPRSRLPARITVVAWQLGRVTEPRLKAAPSVERSFFLLP